jgi:hypothetical protein
MDVKPAGSEILHKTGIHAKFPAYLLFKIAVTISYSANKETEANSRPSLYSALAWFFSNDTNHGSIPVWARRRTNAGDMMQKVG